MMKGSAVTIQLLLLCNMTLYGNGKLGLIYRIKQVRDLLLANQPSDNNDPAVGDKLLMVANQPRGHLSATLGFTGNTHSMHNQSDASPQELYWRNRFPNSHSSDPQMTASMQRPNRPPPSETDHYLGSSRGGQEPLRWNVNRSSAFADRLPYVRRIPSRNPAAFSVPPTELTTPEPASTSDADEFVGRDGKLRMSICDHPNGFLRRQKKLCRRYLHLMESVIRGYFMGLRECEYQFAAHRWNCQGHNLTLQIAPTRRQRLRHRQTASRDKAVNEITPVRIKTYLDKLLSKGTRESAYVLAVTSAGVSHAVTKACSSGVHENCGCDRTIYDHPREPNFEWSGCSDNIHFGAAFSRQFLDVRERSRISRRPKLGLANLHNNHVGRQAVIDRMEVQCKCHGVSGSCEMRTCWRSLPKFRDLGAHLQDRFHKAILVDYVNQQLVRVPDESDGLRTGAKMRRHPRTGPLASVSPTENDLIYIMRSPTFCHHDPGFGSIGTHGRRCQEDAKGLSSCDYLCCGRGFKRETYVQEERCNCKFQWCCKVICQTCRKTVVVSTCN